MSQTTEQRPARGAEPPAVEVPRGRPRDAAREQAILDAALALLGEVGYDRMTVDGIAARARASKATIYRRWSNKGQIVIDALRTHKQADCPEVDTGSLRGDVLAMLGRMCDKGAEQDAAVAVGVLNAMRSDPALGAALREEFYQGGAQTAAPVLARARARGEIPAGAPAWPLYETAPALMLIRLFFDPASVDPDYVRHVADDVVLPLLTRAPSAAGPDLDHQETS